MKHLILAVLFIVVFTNGYTQDVSNTSNAINDFDPIVRKKDSNDNPKYVISRSTLGLGGSSRTISTSDVQYYVSQSIGQSSVIGTTTKRNHTILQGFQVSTISVIKSPDIENALKATIYPNPFEDSINIYFDSVIIDEIFVEVFDMTGRILISKKFTPSQLVNLPLNFFSGGIYSLIITSENKRFVANILKK
jgi:hypothetical protein